jgi:hypothetical protein
MIFCCVFPPYYFVNSIIGFASPYADKVFLKNTDLNVEHVLARPDDQRK